MKKSKPKLSKAYKAILVEVANRLYELGMNENTFDQLPVRQQSLFLKGKGTLITVSWNPVGDFRTVVPWTIKQLAPKR